MRAWFSQWVRFLMPVLVLALLLPLAGCAAAPELNALSWMIYAADLSGNLKVLFGVAAVLAGFAAIPCAVYFGVERNCLYPYWFRHSFVVFVFALLATILPSSTVLYAIAVSQVGEKIIQSEAVTGVADDATKALRAWLKKQTDEPK